MKVGFQTVQFFSVFRWFFYRNRRHHKFELLLHLHAGIFHRRTSWLSTGWGPEERVIQTIHNCAPSLVQLNCLTGHVENRQRWSILSDCIAPDMSPQISYPYYYISQLYGKPDHPAREQQIVVLETEMDPCWQGIVASSRIGDTEPYQVSIRSGHWCRGLHISACLSLSTLDLK